MHVLVTNNSLKYRAGTELYVRDLAIALQRLGHRATCYSRNLGPIADELEAEGIRATDDIDSVDRPDVVHGHHLVETTLAAARFPTTPVVSFCHGPRAWQEHPCHSPNVVRHVAVDEACRRRLTERHGIGPERIRVLLNWVDTDRFPPRTRPLPPRPVRAVVFSNYATEDAPHIAAIRAACAARGVALELVGSGIGRATDDPSGVLVGCDLVFAKARCAIEAMASGCAVIQCDHFGAGRLVTTTNFDGLRSLNFGFESMTFPATVEHIRGEIDRYDAGDAARVAARIRTEASLDAALPGLVDLYAQAIVEARRFDPASLERPIRHLLPVASLLGAGSAAETVGWGPDDFKPIAARLERAEKDLARWRELRGRDKARIERLKQRLEALERRRRPFQRLWRTLAGGKRRESAPSIPDSDTTP